MVTEEAKGTGEAGVEGPQFADGWAGVIGRFFKQGWTRGRLACP